jgi:predicted nucleic acid-binding protein
MVVLIDTDVLIDYLSEREPFYQNAEKVIELRRKHKFNGYISTQCIANIFYVLRKDFSVIERKEILLGLCCLFSVSSVNEEMCVAALENDEFYDLEDCLQMHCAISVDADYIVTRNVKDFEHSSIPAITPERFLNMIN